MGVPPMNTAFALEAACAPIPPVSSISPIAGVKSFVVDFFVISVFFRQKWPALTAASIVVVDRAEVSLRGEDAIVVVVAVIAADDRIVPESAVRPLAHVRGIFADAVLDGVSDLTERVAVMLVLGQGGGAANAVIPRTRVAAKPL